MPYIFHSLEPERFLTRHDSYISLQRIWALGPKRIGPTMLLTSDSANPSSSLFALPDTAVARVSSRQEKKTAMQSAQGGDQGLRRGPQVEDPASRPSEMADADTHSEMSAKVRHPQSLNTHQFAFIFLTCIIVHLNVLVSLNSVRSYQLTLIAQPTICRSCFS